MSAKPITVRIYDKKTKAKLQKLARRHVRFLSQEVEWIVQQYIEDYERQNGEIKIDESVDED
ncbi:hypothetical protein M7775_02360 [Sporomusa sphaeroides DSM 2875]|uniref:hypothetical protein n=1 Tax=Sporomusa sphaeroides TaxID=47679 RepID=UPI002030C67A|nr:hypothetical protein [Sporomusa sphaeroides]MCM0757409.1 hypothetical protein [Sporomusa sphaeroides DSM 2875]